MAKQDDYIRITTRLPPELHETLLELAKKTERSFNGALVATLQAALSEIGREQNLQISPRKIVSKLQETDVTADLIKLIETMPKEKQRSLLILLK